MRHEDSDGSSLARHALDEPASLESEDHAVDGRRRHSKELLHVRLGRCLAMNQTVRPYEGEVLPLERGESWRSLLPYPPTSVPHAMRRRRVAKHPRACESSRRCPSSWSPQNTKISCEGRHRECPDLVSCILLFDSTPTGMSRRVLKVSGGQ